MKLNTLKKILGLFALTALLPAAATITTFYDFNDGDNLGWDGIVQGDTNTATWSSSGGIDGSGGILSGGGGNRTRMITTELSFDGRGELTIGMFFNAHPNDTDGQTDDRASHIGFKDNDLAGQTRNASPGKRFDQADNSVSVRLASLDDDGFKVLSLHAGGGALATSGNVALTGGDWYYWSASFNPTSDGIWNISSSINAVDQTTFTIGSVLANSSLSLTGTSGPSFEDFTTVWGGIALAPDLTDRGTLSAIDNVTITAIPEPGTLLLVGIALGSLMLFRRRR